MSYDGYDLHLLFLCYFGIWLLNCLGLLEMLSQLAHIVESWDNMHIVEEYEHYK